MPKASTLARLVLNAAKWSATTPGSPRCCTSHVRAASAFAMVSWVVNVLDATKKSVRAGSTSCRVSCRSAPSTLATKCIWIPRWAKGLRASTAMRGPRSLPPMPMLTTCLNFSPDADRTSPLRTASAKSSMRSRSRAIRGRTSWPSTSKASVELERSAVWSTARPSVSLIAAPSSCERKPSATPHSSKSLASRSRVVSSTRCLA